MSQRQRGDIALVAGGTYASKPRPGAVIQDNLFDGTDSLTVCPLTTTDIDAPLLRMAIPADERTGITSARYITVDKLTTVRRSNASRRVGQLDAAQMLELERRIVVFLGLAR